MSLLSGGFAGSFVLSLSRDCFSRSFADILKILEKMNYNLEQCRKSLFAHLERRRQLFPRFYFLAMDDVMHIVCNSYDLKQVNLYINKLFANVGMLVHKEVADGERMMFQITAVKSALGEKLPFREVRMGGYIFRFLLFAYVMILSFS